jgi:transposase
MHHATTARLRPTGHLTGVQQRDHMQVILDRMGATNDLRNLSDAERTYLRDCGYMERTAEGAAYVRGQRINSFRAEDEIHKLGIAGYHVRQSNYPWTAVEKDLCPCWEAVRKYVQNDYGTGTPGARSKMTDDQHHWLRCHAIANPKRTLTLLRVDLWAHHQVNLSVSRISVILNQSGLSRQRIQYIATQRFTQSNVDYSRDYAHHMRRFARPAFFDCSGITKDGQQSRRSQGWNHTGAGGAFLTMPLRNWPNQCLTVMGMHDRSGVFAIEVHTGGTNQEYLRPYFFEAAQSCSQRGVDVVVVDNCLAHKTWVLEYFFNRLGIAVVFLPRYWPEWNPIELVWNHLKDFLTHRMDRLGRQTAAAVIKEGLRTVTRELSRSFLRKSKIYPEVWFAEVWAGPGPE